MAITTYTMNRHMSATGNPIDEIFDGGGGFFNSKTAAQLILAVKRFGQGAGTTTLDAYWEWLFEPDNTWIGMVDESGAALTMVQWATAAVDATPRYMVLNNLVVPTGTLTNGGITIGTNNKLFKTWIPEKFRVRFRGAGSATAQNDYAAQMMIHAI
jgi:hypothetical protein